MRQLLWPRAGFDTRFGSSPGRDPARRGILAALFVHHFRTAGEQHPRFAHQLIEWSPLVSKWQLVVQLEVGQLRSNGVKPLLSLVQFVHSQSRREPKKGVRTIYGDRRKSF